MQRASVEEYAAVLRKRYLQSERAGNAELYLQTPFPKLLFAMLDGKPYADHIWRQLRPEATRPFREDL